MIAPTRVLVVDDSALARQLLKDGLSADPALEVVATAPDAYVARDKIVRLKPDVITLDIEMPRMDGIDFLKRLMPQYPLPVIVVSAMAAPGAKATLEALENGAVDFVLKPTSRIGSGLATMIEELRGKIKMAATADVSGWLRQAAPRTTPTTRVLSGTTDKVVAIGASTGGTVALDQIISQFPADMPGTVVVQHMPPVFTKLFADRMNERARVEVKEAESGDRVLTGRVIIAPGDKHLTVIRSGGRYLTRGSAGEKVNGHRPSVDVLFESVARHVGSNAIGVVLTGMGKDGATGLVTMRRTEARTFAQDEKTSVVFGMPREAFAQGGAERLVPLGEIADTILDALEEMV